MRGVRSAEQDRLQPLLKARNRAHNTTIGRQGNRNLCPAGVEALAVEAPGFSRVNSAHLIFERTLVRDNPGCISTGAEAQLNFIGARVAEAARSHTQR